MRFETLVNVVLTMLAVAFMMALGAWIAVADHRAELFLPLTWTAGALATPAMLAALALILRITIERMGVPGAALSALGIALIAMTAGAQAVLVTIPLGMALVFSMGFGDHKAAKSNG